MAQLEFATKTVGSTSTSNTGGTVKLVFDYVMSNTDSTANITGAPALAMKCNNTNTRLSYSTHVVYCYANGTRTNPNDAYIYSTNTSSTSFVTNKGAAEVGVTITKTHSTQNIPIKIDHRGVTVEYYQKVNTGGGVGSTAHYVRMGETSLSFETTPSNAPIKYISVGPKTSYTVSFNANSGTGAPAAQTKWYGETLTLSSTKPTRTGYTFSKWNTKSDGSGTSYSAGGSYTANAAATLYARWTANTYTVSFNANGGSGAPSAQTKTYGSNLTLTTAKPTRSGYTFVKWNTKSDGTGTSYNSGGTYSANAAVTLYAIWTANKFTITYNANGGTIADSPHAWVSSNNDTYRFKINLNNSIIQRTGANNTTYTDTWYSVSYNSAFNLTNYTSANISRTGYHIDAATAWNTKADGSGTSYNQDTDYAWTTLGSLTTAITNVTLYANWKPNPYPLNFNPNGGQCDTASKTVNYQEAYGTLPTPTRDGYTFTGWYTTDTGGTKVSASTTMQTIDGTTVYAHWTPTTYYIYYTLQGGINNTLNPSQYNIESANITIQNPHKMDHTFVGWTFGAITTPIIHPTIPTGSFGDRTLVANWHQNYFVPTLVSQSFVVKRCDRDGNDTDDGEYFSIEFSWQPGRSYTYNPSNGEISDDTEVAPDRYTIIITDQTNSENSQTYDNIEINAVIDETTHTYSNTKVSKAFDYDFFEENTGLERIVIEETKTYSVQLILYKDEVSSTTIHPTETASSFISKSYFCIDINGDGTAIGFGTPVKDGDELGLIEGDVGIHIDMNVTLRDGRDFYIVVDESDSTNTFVTALDALGWI